MTGTKQVQAAEALAASDRFPGVLDHLRSQARSEAQKGRLFERLMKTYLTQDPLYHERFAEVYLWSEWTARRADFDGGDFGIDLVATERDGGVCAIQCKCYAPGTRLSKPHLDSFISASARDPFTARLLVDTGDEWGDNARRAIAGLQPACTVLRWGDLAERPFLWPDLACQEPETLAYQAEPFALRPHQQAAFDDVLRHFHHHDRGQLIMACGTGKTFTALRIAEAVAAIGGRVLYLVPSISLFQQSMREWATQRALPHRYLGICSDTRAGRNDEDASLEELELPVTTDPAAISQALQNVSPDRMTAVFCTYQSLDLIRQAQADGAPPFDLILCDEAHRTTGVERPGDRTSPFVLVHDGDKIRAAKRLYMTATPRLYTERARAKAAEHQIDVFSMDDEATYGPECHRLPFSQAVEQNLLSDYRVVVLAMSEQHVDAALQAHLATGDGEITLSDAAKIVGCWRALQNPENQRASEKPIRRLGRAIAFTNTIKASQRLEAHWDRLVAQAIAPWPEAQQRGAFRCETRHVDGQHHALDRKARLEWLKGSSPDACRILSNARCLSEGIDVPALDAVLFMSPRNSQVDIVQAVGRVMRKAAGKTYGYIVLPVAVPAGVDPASALDDNNRFAAVWDVLRALRSHDDRFDAEIHQIDLNRQPTPRIIFGGDGIDEKEGQIDLPFPPLELPAEAIYAKIVDKCGDRKYWETWAKDVADIFARLVTRIEGLLDHPDHTLLRDWFAAFHDELKGSIHELIPREGAIDMMAQHILTQPVFEALFEQYRFSAHNPVAQALEALRADFGEFGLEHELRDLEGFYESVRRRARGLDNSEARQRVLMELYEKFFATALKKEADRLGIVYTPVEIVDFLLHSADHVLQQEFGHRLSDEGVCVLDPFTGTGIFLVRLLQSALVRDTDLARKYRQELYANEVVLLAYYIATIHIEEAYHGRRGEGSAYEPFGGIALTDTFNVDTTRTGFPKDWLAGNHERVERQQRTPIQVVVGNPPWSAGQRSAADDNPNVDYPKMEQRVAETYAARSTATLKSSLYDTYKMAIRWASDRIGDQGVVALVTNGSWIDGNVDAGVRACLAEEFHSIHVVNLRGNQRTHGERSRQEGGKVFGQGSRAPVALTILVRNPEAGHEGCRILYHDIGDYLTREKKLEILREAGSIAGIEEWQMITPDRHHDWIGQRDDAFQKFYPMGSKEVKDGKSEEAIFQLFSNGYKTGRDAYVYNFSRDACAAQARKMVDNYLGALRELADLENPTSVLDQVVRRHSSNLRWDDKLKRRVQSQAGTEFSNQYIRKVAYRPFVKQHLYADPSFSQRPGRTGDIFPAADPDNRVICVPGVGSTKPFSVLIVDTMPDLELISKGQCFPRYRYERGPAPSDPQGQLYDRQGLQRVDNITDTALRAFQTHYGDPTIRKDHLFEYVYGLLHAPEYRKRFANDLAKELPRVPMVPAFHAYAEAGRALADLHLGADTGPEYPLQIEFTQPGSPPSEHYRIGKRAMRYADVDKTILLVNDFIRLSGIPAAAHQYQVNGRTPLEWLIDRYQITRDNESGLVNDPNGWFDDPEDLIAAICRVVQMSVETVRVVERLPTPFDLPNKGGIWAALRRSPLVGTEIDLTRPREEGREVMW